MRQKVKRVSLPLSLVLGLNAGNLWLNYPKRWCNHLCILETEAKREQSQKYCKCVLMHWAWPATPTTLFFWVFSIFGRDCFPRRLTTPCLLHTSPALPTSFHSPWDLICWACLRGWAPNRPGAAFASPCRHGENSWHQPQKLTDAKTLGNSLCPPGYFYQTVTRVWPWSIKFCCSRQVLHQRIYVPRAPYFTSLPLCCTLLRRAEHIRAAPQHLTCCAGTGDHKISLIT